MTDQPNPFTQDTYGGFSPPLVRAHRADPVTSHQAATRLKKSGKVKLHRAMALALVKALLGMTAHELWMSATDEQRLELGNYHELYRRLADLKNASVIEQGEPRACTIKGTRMMTWRQR